MSTSVGSANGGSHEGEDEFVHEIAVEVSFSEDIAADRPESLMRRWRES